MLASVERSLFALGSWPWPSQRADHRRALGSGATVSAFSGASDRRPPRQGRAAPPLAPAGLPALICVIEFHNAAQRLAVLPLAHRLYRAVVAHPQLGVLDHGVGNQRGLLLAAGALQGLAPSQLATLVVAATGAAESLWPARLEQRLDALIVRLAAFEDGPQALSRVDLDTIFRRS